MLLNDDNEALEQLSNAELWQKFNDLWDEFEATQDEKAVELCIECCAILAERSDTDAMVALGDILQGMFVDNVLFDDDYLDAYYTPKNKYWDYSSAAFWYEEAARGGNINGMLRFAEALYYGWGVAKNSENTEKAFELFKQVSLIATDQAQLSMAYVFLADMISAEEVSCKDRALAVAYIKNVIDIGISCSVGLNLLGCMYVDGYGVEQNYSEAFKLFNEAYEQDKNPYAAFNLGRMYRRGLSVDIDTEQAKHWYRIAIKQGHPGSEEEFDVKNLDGSVATKKQPTDSFL
jgi:TPR repeat protein